MDAALESAKLGRAIDTVTENSKKQAKRLAKLRRKGLHKYTRHTRLEGAALGMSVAAIISSVIAIWQAHRLAGRIEQAALRTTETPPTSIDLTAAEVPSTAAPVTEPVHT